MSLCWIFLKNHLITKKQQKTTTKKQKTTTKKLSIYLKHNCKKKDRSLLKLNKTGTINPLIGAQVSVNGIAGR